MFAGLIAGWVATAALAGFIAIKFATAAPSTPTPTPTPTPTSAQAQAPAPATNQLVTQATAPAPAASAPAAAAPAAAAPAAAAPATPPAAAAATVTPTPAESAGGDSDILARLAARRAAEAAGTPMPATPPPAPSAPATAPTPSMVAATSAAAAPAVPVPAPMAPAAPVATAPRVSYADLTAGEADQGLRLNLRNVTVDQALNYLTESAGFTINRQTATGSPTVQGTVDVVSDTPLNQDEIVALFNKVLASHDLTAIQDKKTLTIMTIEEAEKARRHPGPR